MIAKVGRAGAMNRGATIVFAPTRLVPGRISDQLDAGSHRFAGRTAAHLRGAERKTDEQQPVRGWLSPSDYGPAL